jgi:hypothetical protein
MGGRDEVGEIYTSLLATRVHFAHLPRSQWDKFKMQINFKFKKDNKKSNIDYLLENVYKIMTLKRA